jgi:hypothetical protein
MQPEAGGDLSFDALGADEKNGLVRPDDFNVEDDVLFSHFQ